MSLRLQQPGGGSVLVELVRGPAALTVLGDSLAGAAAAGTPLAGRRLLLPVASAALYASGMALNDWADRDLDALERPERPIPSGRISPAGALKVAAGLTAAGLGVAALAGGRPGIRAAVPLAAAVWSYDLLAKPTPAGPAVMAACRALDVLLGAGPGGRRRALPAAAAVAGHTLGLTVLSRGEVHGGSRVTALGALAGTAAATALTASGPAPSRLHRVAGLAGALGYAGLVGRRQLAAARTPSPAAVRSATVAGIHGMVPLQSAITARSGAPLPAAVLSLALPLARRLGRKVSPT
ncbi:MAG TPA: UbiA family prenyltransferase [Jatrophihabitans sp.]|nr:UbiA family prenyltransferase [Jatrophihabitans sp.]